MPPPLESLLSGLLFPPLRAAEMSDGRPGGRQVRAEGREAGRPSSAPTALGVAGSLLTQGSLFELNGLRSGGHTRYSRSSRHWSPEDREHFRRHGTMTGNAVSARKEVRFPRTRAETALPGEWRPDPWSAAQQSSRPPAGTGSVPGGREPTWHRLFRVASPRLELVGVTDRGARAVGSGREAGGAIDHAQRRLGPWVPVLATGARPGAPPSLAPTWGWLQSSVEARSRNKDPARCSRSKPTGQGSRGPEQALA